MIGPALEVIAGIGPKSVFIAAGETLAPVRDPLTGRPIEAPEILSMAQMDAFDDFLSELYACCEKMGIPAQTATSECGLGQFEITINHQPALRAADDAWFFKMLLKGLARRHGFAASFMAPAKVTRTPDSPTVRIRG